MRSRPSAASYASDSNQVRTIAALIALIAPHCPSMTLIAPLIATNAVNSETEPPRVVVFAPSANAAVELASRLQGAIFGTVTGDGSAGLWGLSVLLPSAESRLQATLNNDTNTLSVLESSLRVMEMFACNRTSVLVTTAAATRGLDFPQVT